jgi:hypothetical protein
MKKNMGTIDRVVRLVVAALVGILFATNVISGVLAIILLSLSGVFVVTSIIGFCPLYALVGIKTCPAERV